MQISIDCILHIGYKYIAYIFPANTPLWSLWKIIQTDNLSALQTDVI